MIKYYTTIDNKICELKEGTNECWINITNPSVEEINYISNKFDVPDEFLTAVFDPEERPRFEREDNVLMILIRMPIENDLEESKIPYITRPLVIIYKDNLILTICMRSTPIINDFLIGRVKNFNTNYKIRFGLQILSKTVIKYLNFLKDIDKNTTVIEEEFQAALKNEEILKLLSYEKSLVYFTTSLRSNQIILERVKKTHIFRLAVEEDRDLLEDVIIDNTQAIEMAYIYTNILSGLMDTFASVISNNVNNIMRTLTKFTIVLILPTLVTSFFGMNVILPLEKNHNSYLIILLICIILSLITFIVLQSKKWF